MVKDNFVNDVRSKAKGHWEAIFQHLDIPTNRSEGECPSCGGKTRYRFDDREGRGTYHCSHCGAGTGLDLVMKVNQCDARSAAEKVASVMSLPLPEPKPARDKPQSNIAIADKVAALVAKTVSGESQYLLNKGLPSPSKALLSDGSLLLVLQAMDGTTTGAQVINPDGSKRLLAGTTKKGSFIPVRLQSPTENEQPVTVLIAEGYATGVTVSLLGNGVVLAALDEGNLIHVAKVCRAKWPLAKIIIAADNDWHEPGECDEKGKSKLNIGVISAEKAAISVSGWVATPPTHHKADWDDCRQQNGIEATTRAFTESLYQPKGASMSVQLKAIEGGKKDRQQTDPLKPHIISRKDGIFWVTPKVDKDSGEIINNESWLCSPLEVIGTGRDDKDQYLIIRWLPIGEDIPTTAAVPLADIGEREGWRTLKAGGVNVTTKSTLRAILADWLQRSGSLEIWRVAQATGWQCGAYIMPDGEIIGTPEKPVLFNGRSAAAAGYTVKGTPESWRDSVARLARGNSSMMAGIGAALAAPLIGLAGADGFGIHFYEQSSSGKTTTANIASSLYGEPDALRLTWFGTALGIANEAAAHNDGLMPLDEVGQGADPDSVAKSAYTLFNGVGKLQGAKEGGNRDLKRWRTVALSTGEMDIETFIASSGRKVKAGQLVRLLNIPLEKAHQHHETPNGKAHADALKDAYQHNYGAAGRYWIKHLADHQQQAVAAVREAESRWRSLIPADYGEQVHRVAARFAVLEAALLFGRVVTGWDKQECRDAIQHNFNAWIKEFGTGNKEHQQIIEQTEGFLNAYGLSRFAPLPYDPQSLPIRDLAGYRDKGKHDRDAMVFYTFPAAFEDEIARGFNVKHFAKALAGAGMLTPPASGRGYQRKSPRIDGRQINVYVIQHMPESSQPDE
ncbi:TOPRIM and DUF927 domain-containing protein [Yersinia pseudotuberculosis]|uniref:TOPRIM and DUF927 domain-containing protein n=1 Tax=Yersinia pseudotuberculosis TaxID=633 RepID=UPI000BF0FDED|nr:TOPRIM and DUF927 domain-containing protein [Yersinia pseudotuberculosis]AXY35574.1 DUF927 domain-containing protein [Yersinia pseudotuberculosis]AYX11236.1 DUF927 domain-containing protein [Yersinia pseudotuberculosis]MBO1568125.1 DUF927 domain-containing protein [Yersinia pseudotuberculosis]MBO1602221.1 DUF927 domain-containing protein [Yersinia pseudotuberculosis]PEI15142.1 DNA primase [Yersinia pseudotuberculosis]